MRKLILIAAVHSPQPRCRRSQVQAQSTESETFTESFSLFGPDPCVDKFVTGISTQSGTATLVETPNGGFHVRVDFSGTVDLYEANGPGPGTRGRVHSSARGPTRGTAATRLRPTSRARSPE